MGGGVRGCSAAKPSAWGMSSECYVIGWGRKEKFTTEEESRGHGGHEGHAARVTARETGGYTAAVIIVAVAWQLVTRKEAFGVVEDYSGVNRQGGAESGPLGCDVDWPYRADPPQRFTGNFQRYLDAGGLARPHDDVQGFVRAEPGNAGDMGRFFFFCMVLDQIAKEGVAGDFLELGVYKGSTAFVLATMARRLGRTLYLLDTFEGFAAADLRGIDADKSMGFGDTSLDAVRGLVGEQSTRFIKGFFPGTATALPANGRYALVHIDCDLYAPIKAALDYFYPRMVPGGFLIVHDYSSLHWNGAEQAVDEFFADKVEYPVPLTDSAGSVVVRKARSGLAVRGWRAAVPELPLDEWVSAENGGLDPWLGAGWSDREQWGVWGIGEAHELLLPVPDRPVGDLELVIDVHAALLENRKVLLVDVAVAAETLETWVFTIAENRGVRMLRIPAHVIAQAVARERRPLVRVELWPRDVVIPAEIDPRTRETRPLGVALHRLRVSHIGSITS